MMQLLTEEGFVSQINETTGQWANDEKPFVWASGQKLVNVYITKTKYAANDIDVLAHATRLQEELRSKCDADGLYRALSVEYSPPEFADMSHWEVYELVPVRGGRLIVQVAEEIK